jgi:hypothetical protein
VAQVVEYLLASIRYWVQTPVPPKTKNKTKQTPQITLLKINKGSVQTFLRKDEWSTDIWQTTQYL